MTARWKKDRTQLLAWANERQKEEETETFGVSKGNLIAVAGLSLAAVAGLYYYTSTPKQSVESKLNAVDEEIDVEEEYLEYDSE